jgi:hypothetical protein
MMAADVLIQAAINGARTRAEHPGIPVTSEQQAEEAAAAVAAGAGRSMSTSGAPKAARASRPTTSPMLWTRSAPPVPAPPSA